MVGVRNKNSNLNDWETYKKTEGQSRNQPYGIRLFSYPKEDTLISSIIASYLLNLTITYTLIRTHFGKSDNLHFNGDYRKKLIHNFL